MSIEAIVSGQANVALFWEGASLYSLHPGGEPVRRRERDIAHLLGDATDLLHFQGIDRSRVASELDIEVRRADALHLALMLLDVELEAETREEAAAELEELFADARISEYVESVLYSRPLPGEADIRGAIEAARATSRVSIYVSELVRHQEQITDAWIAWQGIPDDFFARSEDRQQALKTAVRSGGFRRLAGLLFQGKPVDLLLAEALTDSDLVAVPKHREIWERWVKPLREESRYPEQRLEVLDVAEPADSVPKVPNPILIKFLETPDQIIGAATGASLFSVGGLAEVTKGKIYLPSRGFIEIDEAVRVTTEALKRQQELMHLDLPARSVSGIDEAIRHAKEALKRQQELMHLELRGVSGIDEAIRLATETLQRQQELMHLDLPARSVSGIDEAIRQAKEVLKRQEELMHLDLPTRSVSGINEAIRVATETLRQQQELLGQAEMGARGFLQIRRDLEHSLLSSVTQKNIRIFKQWRQTFAIEDLRQELEGLLRPDLGMLHALGNRFDLARREFFEGLRYTWSPLQESYLKTAQAAVEIQLHQFAQAMDTLSAVVLPNRLVVADVLRLHALGALGHRDDAKNVAQRLPTDSAKVVKIGAELNRRYIEGKPPALSDRVVCQIEFELVAAA